MQSPDHRNGHDEDHNVGHHTQYRNRKVELVLHETVVRDPLLPETLNGHTLEQEAEEGAHEAHENKCADAVDDLPKELAGEKSVVEKEDGHLDGGHHPDPGYLLGIYVLQRNCQRVKEWHFEASSGRKYAL